MSNLQQVKRPLTKVKPETCEEKLNRMVDSYAEDLSSENSKQSGYDFLYKHGYSIRYIVDSDLTYRAAEILVAGGGPNIWVCTDTNTVEGYWGSDKVTSGYTDNIGLDEACEEEYNAKKGA